MKKPDISIIDLHCDLLSFLSHHPGRSVQDPQSRTCLSQLNQGSVKLQTLAIFSTTHPKSVHTGQSQVEHFLKLLSEYPTAFALSRIPLLNLSPSLIHIIPAFENASAFAEETEPLSDVFQRLEKYRQILGPIFYITMTWNEENRFGGGNMTTVGLKEDGKLLLEWMDKKKIAIDLSHTSDKLAYELIDFIDKKALDIPIIASHSNFRSISDWQRNLPDDLAKEIVRRCGLIGLNLFAPFIHNTDYSAITRHVEYGLALGGGNVLSFGADFFCDADFPALIKKYQRTEAFYPELANSSAYPALLGLLFNKLGLQEEQLLKIASQNALRFLNEKIL